MRDQLGPAARATVNVAERHGASGVSVGELPLSTDANCEGFDDLTRLCLARLLVANGSFKIVPDVCAALPASSSVDFCQEPPETSGL